MQEQVLKSFAIPCTLIISLENGAFTQGSEPM